MKLRNRVWGGMIAVFLLGGWCSFGHAQRPSDYEAARKRMVELVAEAVTDPRVLDAVMKTERHLFVSPDQRKNAYFDMALPIGSGATISPPGIVGFMTEQLDPQPTDKVLEIGTGSGYQAAILSPLVAEVYTIEIIESLGRRAAARLQQLGYENVHVKIGDGFEGWPEHAPFDKIIVTCSPEEIPVPLVEQLREGGLMVIPLGQRYQQSLCLVKKENGELKREILESTFFIPMTGKAEDLREVAGDEGLPRLTNGGFEEVTDRDVPAGWYYLRQAELVTGDDVFAGTRSIRFASDTRGRSAHALQAFGVDGRRYRQIKVSMMAKWAGITRPGSDHSAGVDIRFYDEKRTNVGGEVLGPWTGTSDWTRKEATVRVPPRARLAVIGIGMFGVTGEMMFDEVAVQPGP